MSITESFLVNTNCFDPIIKALIKDPNTPAKITDSYLNSLGFDNPSDLLVIHLLKSLNVLEEDGKPTSLFHELRDPGTSRMALAKGIVHAYEDLFIKHSLAHKMQLPELKEAFSEVFEGEKTELILKYMANTFERLVSFAGSDAIEKAKERITDNKDSVPETIHEVNGLHKNATSSANGNGTTLLNKEPKSDTSFDDLAGLNNGLSDTKTPPPETGSENGVDAERVQPEQLSPENIEGEIDKTDSEEDTTAFESIPAQESSLNQATSEAPLPIQKGVSLSEGDEKVQKAIIKKADLLYKMERHEEVLPLLNEIITCFEQSNEPLLEEAVSRAIIRRAVILNVLQRYDQALPALDKVISKFAASENEEYYKQASIAMLRKAQILEKKNQLDQAVPLFNSIIERLEKSDDPEIREQVETFFLKRLDILNANSEVSDSDTLVAANQLIERFNTNKESHQRLKEAMFRKAEILERMNRDEEALIAYNEYLERFGNDSSGA